MSKQKTKTLMAAASIARTGGAFEGLSDFIGFAKHCRVIDAESGLVEMKIDHFLSDAPKARSGISGAKR